MSERRCVRSLTVAVAVTFGLAAPATAGANPLGPLGANPLGPVGPVEVQAAPPIGSGPVPALPAPTTRTAAASVRVSGKLSPKRKAARSRAKARRRARARRSTTCQPGTTLNCAGLPLHFTDNNECTGDVVYITGFYHVLIQTTTSGDGTIRTKAYTNYQNSSGVGVPSGLKYQANLTSHTYERVDPFPGTVDMEVRDNYELISNGPSPNMLVRFRFRVRVDALGVPTVSISGTDARCVG